MLQLAQPCLDVLAVAERAALATQQQTVEELHVDEGEDLREQLAHQERRHVAALERVEQVGEDGDDGVPVATQGLRLRRAGGRAPAVAPVGGAGGPGGLDAQPQRGRYISFQVVP
eukprot:TRINITY_DN14919_c0_g2_i1.p4 TRINITY_DN14919_c0_g2~~TRINITY_DN14919_c0_g2_i1.p4  ORF type:complete len:115 (-),score=8.85 TRINITY_DN14919_c0_g2_i1:180-524(-)